MNTATHHRKGTALAAVLLAFALPLAGCQQAHSSSTVSSVSGPHIAAADSTVNSTADRFVPDAVTTSSAYREQVPKAPDAGSSDARSTGLAFHAGQSVAR